MVEKASILPSDTVLEIGPGTGNLTEKLLQKGKRVLAYEIDGRLVVIWLILFFPLKIYSSNFIN